MSGIKIRVHPTFALVLALGALQWASFGATGVAFGVVSTVLLFGAVLLHELGHAVVARKFGIPVKDITLWPFGGVARLGGRPQTPQQELLIALAGPAVNVALAGALVAVGIGWLGEEGLWVSLFGAGSRTPGAVTLLAVLLGSNVMLALFNLVPALPMDGGRVLRALLSLPLGARRATEISAMVARVIAVAMFAAAFAYGQVMLAVIAVLVFLGAGREAAEQKVDEALGGVRAAGAVDPHALVLGPATRVGEAVRAMASSGQSAFAVVHGGKLLGVVAQDALLHAAGHEGPFAYVAGAMRRDYPVVDAHASLGEARRKMNEALTPFVVVTQGEHYLGLVTERELALGAPLGLGRGL